MLLTVARSCEAIAVPNVLESWLTCVFSAAICRQRALPGLVPGTLEAESVEVGAADDAGGAELAATVDEVELHPASSTAHAATTSLNAIG